MVSFLLAGSALGLSAGFAPGPLLAMVISHTVRYGLTEGMKLATAPLITDLPIVAGITYLLSGLSRTQSLLGMISLTGSCFLLYLAVENMRISRDRREETPTGANSVMKGAVANALNPHPYLFWLAVGSPLLLNALTHDVWHAAVFLASFYVCLIGSKILLAVLVNRSKGFLSGPAYLWLMRMLGLALLCFAGILFRDGLSLLRGSP